MSVLGLSLLTMLFWGVAPLFEKSVLVKTAPLTVLTIRSLIIVAAYGAMQVASGSAGDLFRVDGRSLLYILASAVLGGIVGLLTYFHALKIGEAALVVPITASYPLLTVLLAVLFLGEPFTLQRVLGAALIVAGVYFVR